MDVLEEKYLSRDLNFLLNVLKLGDNNIRLVGTGSMASQYYPADFDFLSAVKTQYNPTSLYNDFKKIINRIDDNKLFFIEFKLQQKLEKGQKQQEKHKIYSKKELNLDFFLAFYNEKTELCKIDCIIWHNGTFKEVSCIYFFDKGVPLSMNDYRMELLKDGKEKFDEGKVYKSLKRLLLAAKYLSPPDKNLIIAITNFFNSMVGKLYELENMIQAAIIYMNVYGDDKRIKQFIFNIGLDNLPAQYLEQLSKDYQLLINKEARKFYKLYKLTPGKLPQWNSIKPIFKYIY